MTRWARITTVLTGLALAALVVSCSSDDAGDEAGSTSQLPATTGASTVAQAPADLPADYPLPVPDGGTVVSVLVDEGAATSNVTVVYSPEALDELVTGYDTFFDGVAGETVRVPVTDGLASWQNDEAGYSVVVNAQNEDVQLTLQTGI